MLFTKANGALINDYAHILFDDCSKNLFLNKNQWYRIMGKEKVDHKIIDLLCQDFEMTALLNNNYSDRTSVLTKQKKSIWQSEGSIRNIMTASFPKLINSLKAFNQTERTVRGIQVKHLAV